MPIPKFHDFFASVMKCLKDGEPHSLKETVDFCAKYYGLTPEDCKEKLQSGQTVLYNRVCWACTYLSKAELIEKINRGIYGITGKGKRAIANGCDKITLEYIAQIPSFAAFSGREIDQGHEQNSTGIGISVPSDQSPEEMLEDAAAQLNANLSDELLSEIMKMSPYDFEGMVVKLLIKMGYGKPEENKEAVTQKAGDEGIDGIVSADKFGFI